MTLKELRQTAHLTQRQLAELAGVPYSYVAFYERADELGPVLEGTVRRALREQITTSQEALRS
jgi:transcriptional regulator with XRE-family HTH domain